MRRTIRCTGSRKAGSSMGVSRRGRDHDVTLDRIDPALGYVPGNVALVTRRVNGAKGGLPLDAFIVLCEQVAAEARRKRRGVPAPAVAPPAPWWRPFCRVNRCMHRIDRHDAAV
jgi:hypothetical protein